MTPASPVTLPLLVGHRGYPQHYPENSLVGLRAALDAGAGGVEFDVQLSADGVPVVYHDDTTDRTSGCAGSLLELALSAARRLPAGESVRFGERFVGVTVPTLDEFVEELLLWPRARVYLEVKEESVVRHGAERCLAAVQPALVALGERATLISFDDRFIETALAAGTRCAGWVLHRYDDSSHARARTLEAPLLIVNQRKLPADRSPPWPGPWQWMAYDSTDADEVIDLAQRGFAAVESWAVGELIARLVERGLVAQPCDGESSHPAPNPPGGRTLGAGSGAPAPDAAGSRDPPLEDSPLRDPRSRHTMQGPPGPATMRAPHAAPAPPANGDPRGPRGEDLPA